MIDSVKNLVTRLENGFANLDEKEKEYSTIKTKLEQFEKMLDFVGGNAKKLNKYDDQTLIIDAVNKINSNSKEYEGACYLLDSDDESVMMLPQYRNSRTYLETIINYLKMEKENIYDFVNQLNSDCTRMKLNEKYFKILNQDVPFVEDVEEFLGLLDQEEVTKIDKNQIISYVIKSNVNNYIKRIKGEEK